MDNFSREQWWILKFLLQDFIESNKLTLSMNMDKEKNFNKDSNVFYYQGYFGKKTMTIRGNNLNKKQSKKFQKHPLKLYNK